MCTYAALLAPQLCYIPLSSQLRRKLRMLSFSCSSSRMIFLMQCCVDTHWVLTLMAFKQKRNTREAAPEGPGGIVVNVAPAEKDT